MMKYTVYLFRACTLKLGPNPGYFRLRFPVWILNHIAPILIIREFTAVNSANLQVSYVAFSDVLDTI